MNILMVAPFEAMGRYKGGITYIAENICDKTKHFNNKNIKIEKFNTCRRSRNIKKTGKFSIDNILNFFKIYIDLQKKSNKESYDIIYYHSSIRLALLKDLIVISKISKKKKNKIILHIHFAEYDKIMFSSKLINKIIIFMMNKSIEKVIFLSKETAKEFINKGLYYNKASVVYNFHNLEYSEIELKNKVDLQNVKEKIEIVFLASLDRRKGILDALEALTRIKENYIFNICGTINDLSIEDDFNKRIKQLGDRVKLHGYVSGQQKKDLLLRSDILVLPSYGEGLPISIIEGLAGGCSIITTNVGAIPEVFGKNNGYIINPGNIDDLSEKFNVLISNHKLRKKYIENNIEYSNEFKINKFIKNIESVFEEVSL